MPPSPAHELCKLISQQQLDKAVDYFESLYLCFCGRVGNSVNEPIETLLLSTINYFESLYLCFCGRVGNSVNEPIETLLLSTQMIPIMTSPPPRTDLDIDDKLL